MQCTAQCMPQNMQLTNELHARDESLANTEIERLSATLPVVEVQDFWKNVRTQIVKAKRF